MSLMKSFAREAAFHLLPPSAQQKIATALQKNLIERTDDLPALNQALDVVERSEVRIEDRIRKIKTERQSLPDRFDYSGSERLECWSMNERAPWRALHPEPVSVPGMLTAEEILYFNYVGRFFSGAGAAVELGPWLGLSTRHIIRGLETNPNFNSARLHVFDDFVWRSDWMDPHTPNEDRLANHSDFQGLFEKYAAPVRDRLIVTKAKIADFDGNENRPRIDWRNGPIEIMYIDCGRTLQANQGWYDTFSPSFLPGVTLLVMQDWRLHRERPRKPFNQTDVFTRNLGSCVRLIHEVSDGGIATFLFEG